MKIDFHVHVTPPQVIANPQKFAKKEPYFALLAKSPNNKYAAAENVIAALDESHFDKAVIFGFSFNDMALCRMVNDYVIEKVQEFPDRLICFMSISPNAKGMEAEIQRCKKAGLCGIGEIFKIEFDNEKQTRPLTDLCIELDIPLMVHVNEPVGHNYIGKNDIPLQKIERFIQNSRGAKIVLAHLGGGLFLYEAMKGLSEKFCNVYYDTAAVPFLYDERIYRAVASMGLCNKVLFGSDFPLLKQARCLEGLEKSGISSQDKELILGTNAVRLL